MLGNGEEQGSGSPEDRKDAASRGADPGETERPIQRGTRLEAAGGQLPGRPAGVIEAEEGHSVLKIGGRIVAFLILIAIVYAGVRELSYVIFGPHLEVLRAVTPEGLSQAGTPVTIGAVVRNKGIMAGASFVVAALGNGVEVEGPTLDVPSKDSALIPVRVTLPSGEFELSLVVFDGWRGVKRLQALRGIPVSVEPQTLDSSAISMSEEATQGDPVTVTFPWVNLGVVPEKIVPVVVFHADEGGPPIVAQGATVEVGADRRDTLTFNVDTWPLQPGRYSAQILVESESGERVGRGSRSLTLDVAPVVRNHP